MKRDTKLAIKKLTATAKTLEQARRTARTALEKDGLIQRFEYTFEQMWKTLRRILAEKGAAARFPRDVLKEAFRSGFINEDKTFAEMLDARNRLSHVYSEKEAFKYLLKIKKKFIPAILDVALKCSKWKA